VTTRTYRALLVANSTFPNDPHNLPDLEGPRNDPALLRDALCDRVAGLVPSDNVRLVTERTMSEVLREVEDFLRTAARQDTLILYYSGHGVLDQSNELFLCTRDTRSDRLRSTAVKASDVSEMIDESAAATTVILLDCCHSGRFKGGDLPATLAGRGRFVVSSSRSGELANDTDVRNHASLFTHHLVQGLLDGAEDRDADGVVSLSDVYEYVHAALVESGRQVPQKRFEGDGDVPMALRTATTVAHPQPELLDPALVEPELDVPETVIDLGEIDSDEVLPPERVAVVNRGGGELQWTVESSADWVAPLAEEHDVVLHLSPVPGPNRANVYIRDTRTGAIKTVRISVRVRSPAAASVPTEAPLPTAALLPTEPEPVSLLAEPEPSVAEVAESEPWSIEVEPPPEPEPSVAVPPPETFLGADVSEAPERPSARVFVTRWIHVVAALLSILAGVTIVDSGASAGDAIYKYFGALSPIVRTKYGSGLLPVMLAGGLLALAGVITFVRPVRDAALGVAVAVAIPTAFERLGEHAASVDADGCFCIGPDDGVPAFRGAALVCLLAAACCAAALILRRTWRGQAWLPARAVGIGVAAAVVWGWMSTLDLYRYYTEHYGSYTYYGGTGWHVLAIAAVVAGIIVASRFAPAVGAGMVIGAVAWPVFASAGELVHSLSVLDDDGYSVWRITPMILSGAVLVGVAVWAARRAVATRQAVPSLAE
jgi:hypothetical protein